MKKVVPGDFYQAVYCTSGDFLRRYDISRADLNCYYAVATLCSDDMFGQLQ
ncbi:MAG: hypothetical protein J6Q81_00680 [Lentisphaeria bacterium]|nr:hypothetical protein [Lentisphaeria bacterium]